MILQETLSPLQEGAAQLRAQIYEIDAKHGGGKSGVTANNGVTKNEGAPGSWRESESGSANC